jgi:hypothetical protein
MIRNNLVEDPLKLIGLSRLNFLLDEPRAMLIAAELNNGSKDILKGANERCTAPCECEQY